MGFSNKIKRIYHRVDYSASKKIFGNTAGARNNLSGTMSGVKSSQKIDNELVSELKRKQHLLLEQPYDNVLIKKIISKYSDMIEKEDFTYGTGEYEGKAYSIHIQKPHKNIPEVGHLIEGDIVKIIEGYYGGPFKISRIDLWRNLHTPKEIESTKETFSNYWHCDARDLKYLKLFVLLSDVTENDGPFHIISQQRTKQIMKMGFGTREDYNVGEQELEDPEHTLKALGKTGMAYFANTQLCLHKAGMPSKNHQRDVVQFVIEPSNESIKENWIEGFSQDTKYAKESYFNKIE